MNAVPGIKKPAIRGGFKDEANKRFVYSAASTVSSGFSLRFGAARLRLGAVSADGSMFSALAGVVSSAFGARFDDLAESGAALTGVSALALESLCA